MIWRVSPRCWRLVNNECASKRPLSNRSLKFIRRMVKASLEVDYWPLWSVVGLFIQRWEEKHKTKWHSRVMIISLVSDIELLVKREGTRQTVAAIEAVFSQKHMRWVKERELSFLLSEECFYRYVIPVCTVMRNERQPGEQSEWRAARGKKGFEEGQV